MSQVATDEISIDEISEDLPSFLRRVQAGEQLVITQAGRAVAEVKPIAPSLASTRPFGLCAGEITISDDFDEQLPEEILQEFEGR